MKIGETTDCRARCNMKRIRRITLLILAISLLMGSAVAVAESLQDTGTVLHGNGIDSLDLHAYLHAALILPDPKDPR